MRQIDHEIAHFLDLSLFTGPDRKSTKQTLGQQKSLNKNNCLLSQPQKTVIDGGYWEIV